MLTNQQYKVFSRSSFRHRDRVLAAARCGCFYCGEFFAPGSIRDWTDEDPQRPEVALTALCPSCEVDSVLPDDLPGYSLSLEFLREMHRQAFHHIVVVIDPDGTEHELDPPMYVAECDHGFPGM